MRIKVDYTEDPLSHKPHPKLTVIIAVTSDGLQENLYNWNKPFQSSGLSSCSIMYCWMKTEDCYNTTVRAISDKFLMHSPCSHRIPMKSSMYLGNYSNWQLNWNPQHWDYERIEAKITAWTGGTINEYSELSFSLQVRASNGNLLSSLIILWILSNKKDILFSAED